MPKEGWISKKRRSWRKCRVQGLLRALSLLQRVELGRESSASANRLARVYARLLAQVLA
jgi:hypothetical protein